MSRGSTKRERPRKAFEAYKDNYSKKLDFGESSIPEGKIYRSRWVEKKSWLWICIKLIVLLTILTGMIAAIFS